MSLSHSPFLPPPGPTAAGAGSATFENPEHDHPKLIRYTLAQDGSLKAELEGAEGKQTFVFRPVLR